MNSLRDERQQQFANVWLNNQYGILYICPRMGKCRIATIALGKFPPDASVLIAYPDRKIKKSWEDEFAKTGYNNSNVVFTTHLSLKKYTEDNYEVIIIDEVHSLSNAQIEACGELFRHNSCVLGLTGTLSSWTEKTLLNELGLPVLARYSIEQAIREGVITDYEITVYKVPLDRKVKQYKSRNKKGQIYPVSEKEKFNNCSKGIDKLENEGQDTFFMRLNRMKLIQNSLAKLNKTKELLEEHKDERVLVFTGITKIADSLGIPSYHSKTTEKQLFQDFAEARINQLAVCKIGATGVTYTPLNRVIINYTDSNSENLAQKLNRCMSLEYDNPEKKAKIEIVSSDEPVELRWVEKALAMFEKSKIKYV